MEVVKDKKNEAELASSFCCVCETFKNQAQRTQVLQILGLDDYKKQKDRAFLWKGTIFISS